MLQVIAKGSRRAFEHVSPDETHVPHCTCVLQTHKQPQVLRVDVGPNGSHGFDVVVLAQAVAWPLLARHQLPSSMVVSRQHSREKNRTITGKDADPSCAPAKR